MSIADAIAKNFAGDRALYDAFAQSCVQQFSIDAMAGQRACESGDLDQLRRLAHDLASVLLLLGHPALSDLASHIEKSTAAGDLSAATEAWQRLSPALARFDTS